MRSVSEINTELLAAMNHSDVEGVKRNVEEASELTTTEGKALVHYGRGWLANLHSDYEQALAHFEAELELRRELDDLSGEASTLGNIGNVMIGLGVFTDALTLFKRAQALYTSIGQSDGVARMSSSIATVFNRTGDYPSALEQNRIALQIHIEANNLLGQAQVLGNIGNTYNMTGNYPEALEYMTRSLELHQTVGDPLRSATVLGNIGTVHGASGNADLAIQFLQQALEIQSTIGNMNEIARLCGNLAYGHLLRKEFEESLSYINRALDYHLNIGNKQGEAWAITTMVDVYLESGNLDEAKTWLDRLDKLQIDEPDIAIHRIDNHGRHAELVGDYNSAQRHYAKALVLAEQHSLRAVQAEMRKALRDICQKQNNLAGYIEHNNEFTRITEEINGKETATKLAMQAKQREIDAERKEHEKHMAVLHSTLPKHIADRVARGKVVNDHFDNAGVLFLDVVGFTNNSSLLPPGEVVELLQNIFTTFDSICAKHNVTKIKTIGDSYMAVAFPSAAASPADSPRQLSPGNILPDNFSRTISPGDNSHHFNLANAAIEMINAQFTWSHNLTPVEFRIGLHCGPVVAGVLGKERLQYDVWGDTVNVASRMESTGEPGRIHVSEAFAKALPKGLPEGSPEGSHIVFIPRGEIEVKGKGTMKTYWLSSIKD